MGNQGGIPTRTFRLLVARGLKLDPVREQGIAFLDRYGVAKRGPGAPYRAYQGGSGFLADYADFVWRVQIDEPANDVVLDVTWSRPGGGTVSAEANTGYHQDWIDVVFPAAPAPDPLSLIPPTVTITQPIANDLLFAGPTAQVHFAATAVDSTGAQLTGGSMVWDLSLLTVPPTFQRLGVGTSITVPLSWAPEDAARNQLTSHSVRVTATGSNRLTASRSVSVLLGRVVTRAAQFVTQSVPRSLRPGEGADVSVTMRNTGNEPWEPGGTYRLGSDGPQDNTRWGLGRVSPPSPVGPGQDATFAFRITAPTQPGPYAFQWRMLQEGVTWFGEPTPLVTVAVDEQPGPATVPDVLGLSSRAATDAITAAHLVARLVGRGGNLTEVTRQEPSAGELVERWSTVSITVRSSLDDRP